MPAHLVVSSATSFRSFVGYAIFGLAILLLPARALAQTEPPPAPPPSTTASPPTLGGHVGLAVPVISFHSGTGRKGHTTPSDDFTLAVPIGISLHFSREWTFDFETIVANHVSGDAIGSNTFTSFTVDPGIVYTGGPAALGLRVKFDVGGPANIGFIPLVNYGLMPALGGTWFIEGALPITLTDDITPGRGRFFDLSIVIHTGVGF